MSKELMPEEVRDLIVRHIESVAQLEALLFLHARSSELWDVATVAKRLYAPLPDVGCCPWQACRRCLLGTGWRALSLCSAFGSRLRC
jgi:hypothetical protein